LFFFYSSYIRALFHTHRERERGRGKRERERALPDLNPATYITKLPFPKQNSCLDEYHKTPSTSPLHPMHDIIELSIFASARRN
jgi:hypothetical protein